MNSTLTTHGGKKRTEAARTVFGSSSSRRTRWGRATLPLLAIYLLVFVVPEVLFLKNGFYTSTAPGAVGGGATLNTIKQTVSNEFTVRALVTTMDLCLVSAVVAVALAFPLAYGAVHWQRWGSVIFAAVATVMFSNAVALVLGWQVVLSNQGPIDRALMATHIISQPLDLSNNFFAVSVGCIQAGLPLAVIGLMPACGSISRDMLQAADGLGASQVQIFAKLILPHCRTALISMALLVFATIAGSFTTPALLGGGHVPVLALLIYSDIETVINYATASATGLLLLAVVGVVVLIALMFNRRVDVERPRGRTEI